MNVSQVFCLWSWRGEWRGSGGIHGWWIGEADKCKGVATYIMLWPEDGRMKKEDIRGIYDGSIFHVWAEKERRKSKGR